MPAPDAKQVNLSVVLDAEEAWQFAQFLKRMCLSDYQSKASTKDDAYIMLMTGEIIRAALAREGCAPR